MSKCKTVPDKVSDQLPAFQQVQYTLAAHLRNPAANVGPDGVEDRRLNIYRDLFFNNVEGFMAGNFPVIRKILGDEDWHALVRAYYSTHTAHTPLFPKMAQEFVRYLESGPAILERYPFLQELAHYEWVEAALFIEHEPTENAHDYGDDLLDGVPVLNSLAWPLAYQYPVHRISPDFQPQEPPVQPSYLVVYRNADEQVRFMELNPVSARLLELIGSENERSGRDMLQLIADELGAVDAGAVLRGGQQMLAQFAERGIVLGSRL